MNYKIRNSLAVALVAAGLVLVVFLLKTNEGKPEKFSPKPLQSLREIPDLQEPQPGFGPVIEEVLSLRESGAVNEMISLLRGLDTGLDARQQNALLAEMLQPKPDTMAMGGYSSYFHEICLVLIRQMDRDGRFANALATVVNDPSKAPVLRDYAVQHLRNLWDISLEDPKLQLEIEETFIHLTADPTLGATALLSLHLMGAPTPTPSQGAGSVRRSGERSYPVDNERLTPMLKEALAKNDRPEHGLTAIRIISERKLAGFEQFLRAAASRENHEHVMVQMAAIGALSKSNRPEDRLFIKSIHSSDPRITRAQFLALSRP